jgi:hypothetical protein
MVALGPAATIACREIDRVIELLVFAHGELALRFSVSVTVPAAISAALGV